jgi:hypothetical protein
MRQVQLLLHLKPTDSSSSSKEGWEYHPSLGQTPKQQRLPQQQQQLQRARPQSPLLLLWLAQRGAQLLLWLAQRGAQLLLQLRQGLALLPLLLLLSASAGLVLCQPHPATVTPTWQQPQQRLRMHQLQAV